MSAQVYHVFANRSNIGDWLSARAIQAQLRPMRVRELLIDEPFVAESLEALAGAGERDVVVIGGGGLFMDYFLPFWAGFERVAQRGVPFCIWGVGFCDSKARGSRPPAGLLRRILRRSRLCIVRDELTRQALSGCDLPAPVPCPSLLELDRPARNGTAVLHPVHYEVTGAEGYDAICELVKRFARQRDREYLETNNEIQPGSERSLAGELKLYEKAELVVSSRLHGCIIGLAMGCKVLAVSGDRKVESFMAAAGLADWICDVPDLAGIERMLGRLGEQEHPGEFLARARHRNLAVGEKVRALIAAMAGRQG